MEPQQEAQPSQPDWQNVNEGSPKLSQPRADSQQAIVPVEQVEVPPQVSSPTKNLADEVQVGNPEQIAAPETVVETLAIPEQPKEALTLEAEKPSSGTADNTVPNVPVAAPIEPVAAPQTFTPAPVNNGLTENGVVGGETANIVEPQQTNIIPEVNEYASIPQYYQMPQSQYVEPKEEKLFTITMNTYQACRLNSQLCNFGMRVEPIDLKPKKPNNGRRPQKKLGNKLTYGNPSFAHSNTMQRKPIQKYSIADQLAKIDSQLPGIQRANTMTHEENKVNGDVQMYGQKPSDGSDQSVGVNGIMRVDTQQKEGEYEDSDLAGLHPSPQRMSSRRHEHVAGKYVEMTRGIKLDEVENASATAHAQLSRAASSITQKPASMANNNNKKNIEENKAKIKALLENIKHHEFFSILQNSLDFSNPTNEPYQSKYKIFTQIEIQFDGNRFQNSTQIKTEIFQQLEIRIDMYTSNKTELENTINLFNSVKGWFEFCDGLSLVEPPADKRPKPPANVHRRPAPRPAPQPKPAPRPEAGGGSQATQKIILNTVPPEMSAEDKNRLKNNIGLLTQEQKKKVVPIVKKCLQGQGNNNPIFEFELDQLTNECLRELEGYVDKEIKSNIKKEKRKRADKERRQRRIQNNAGKAAAPKYPYAGTQALDLPPAAVATAADAALAAQQKIGGAVPPNQMAIQQQLAQLTQLSHQQLHAQHMQTLLAQLQQGQAFPGMPAPVAQPAQSFQRPAAGQPAGMAAPAGGRPTAKSPDDDESDSSSSSDSD